MRVCKTLNDLGCLSTNCTQKPSHALCINPHPHYASLGSSLISFTHFLQCSPLAFNPRASSVGFCLLLCLPHLYVPVFQVMHQSSFLERQMIMSSIFNCYLVTRLTVDCQKGMESVLIVQQISVYFGVPICVLFSELLVCGSM